jgi:hypothetical protein
VFEAPGWYRGRVRCTTVFGASVTFERTWVTPQKR